MALTAKFIADFQSLYAAVDKANAQLTDLQKEAADAGLSLNRMVTSLSGERAIKDATALAAAVERLGGTSALTAAELEKVGRKAAEAVEKATKLGVEVPPELQKLADAAANAAAAQRQQAEAAKQSEAEAKKLAESTKDSQAAFTAGAAAVQKWALGLVSAAAVISVVKAGVDAIVGFLSDSVKSAADAEAAQADLTAAMAAQGVAVPEVIAAYQGYISALEGITTYSDDALTASAALLQTMGVMPQDMNAALTAATNLAQRFGGDLTKGTELVGKAAIGQTAALKKAGIQLDDSRVKAEGFSYIVDQINTQMEGRAAAAANTYAGRLQQLANQWDNVKEAVGRTVIQNQTVVSAIENVGKALTGVSGDFKVSQDVMNLVSEVVIGLVRAFGILLDMFGVVLSVLRVQMRGWQAFANGLVKVHGILLESAKAMAPFNLGARQMADLLQASQTTLEGFAQDIGKSADMAAQFEQGIEGMSARVLKLADNLTPTIGKTRELTKETNQNANAANLSTENAKRLQEQQEAAAAEAKKLAQATAEIEAATIPLTAAQEEQARSLMALKVSLGTIATQMGVSEAALKRLADADTAAAAATKKLAEENKKAMAELEGSASYGVALSAHEQLVPAIEKTVWALEGLPPAAGKALAAVEQFPPTLKQLGIEFKSFAQLTSEYLGEQFGKDVLAAIQGGGSAIQSALTGFGNMLFGKDSGLAKSMKQGIGEMFGSGGMMGQIGKALSGMVPMIGSLLGPAVEGIGKLLGPLFGRDEESAQVNPLRDKFLSAAGGANTLAASVQRLTGSQELMDQMFRAETVEEYNAAVANLNSLFQQEQTAIADVHAAAERYGLTLKELGPALAKGELDKKAAQLYKDFELLTAAGVKNTTVTKKMAEAVNEYVGDARKMGVQVPSAMRPMLQQMADMGQLTDKSGKKVKNLEDAGISFAMTMSEGFEKLISSVDDLANVLARSLGVELDRTKNKVEDIPDEVKIKIRYEDKGPPKHSGGSIPGYQGGTKGFEDFGRGTLVMLHGKEAVIPQSAVKPGGGGGGGGGMGGAQVTINVYAQGSFFDTPGDLQRLAEKINAALTARHGLTNRLRAA
jgi:hypothetical protein